MRAKKRARQVENEGEIDKDQATTEKEANGSKAKKSKKGIIGKLKDFFLNPQVALIGGLGLGLLGGRGGGGGSKEQDLNSLVSGRIAGVYASLSAGGQGVSPLDASRDPNDSQVLDTSDILPPPPPPGQGGAGDGDGGAPVGNGSRPPLYSREVDAGGAEDRDLEKKRIAALVLGYRLGSRRQNAGSFLRGVSNRRRDSRGRLVYSNSSNVGRALNTLSS